MAPAAGPSKAVDPSPVRTAATPTPVDPGDRLRRARLLGHRPPATPATRPPVRALQRAYADSNNLAAFLAEQEGVQDTAAQFQRGDVPLFEVFDAPFTTVGFEHEFAQMTNGPLLGITHVELTRSGRTMPLTRLPFSLETDADNAIELVSPPFMLETVSADTPIPKPEDVAKVDHMIQQRLAQVVETPKAFGKMVEQLGADPGLDFQAQNATVTASNVNPQIAGKLEPVSESEPHRAEVPVERIGEMTVKKGRKAGMQGAISAQVNFATDAHTYSAMNLASAEPDQPASASNLILPFNRLERNVVQELLQVATADDHYNDRSPGLLPFLHELARRMASTLAVHSITLVEDWKKQIFENREHNVRKKLADERKGEGEAYSLHTGTRSHVKDTQALWLKDTVENVGLGLLTSSDWSLVMRLAGNAGLRQALQDIPLEGVKVGTLPAQELQQNLAAAKQAMVQGLHELFKRIASGGWWKAGKQPEPKDTLSGPERQPPFGSHDPSWLGVRQDTFLSLATPGAQNQPLRWDWGEGRRLHVVETRGAGIRTLLDGEIVRLLREGRQKEEIRKEISLRIGAILEDARARLEEAPKPTSSNKTLPHSVMILQQLVRESEDLAQLVSLDYIEAIRQRVQ